MALRTECTVLCLQLVSFLSQLFHAFFARIKLGQQVSLCLSFRLDFVLKRGDLMVFLFGCHGGRQSFFRLLELKLSDPCFEGLRFNLLSLHLGLEISQLRGLLLFVLPLELHLRFL